MEINYDVLQELRMEQRNQLTKKIKPLKLNTSLEHITRLYCQSCGYKFKMENVPDNSGKAPRLLFPKTGKKVWLQRDRYGTLIAIRGHQKEQILFTRKEFRESLIKDKTTFTWESIELLYGIKLLGNENSN